MFLVWGLSTVCVNRGYLREVGQHHHRPSDGLTMPRIYSVYLRTGIGS